MTPKDFITKLLSVQRIYTVVKTIDPHRTIVAVFKEDIAEAIRFYRQKYSTLPEFALLDAGLDTNAVAAFRKQYDYNSSKLIIFPISARRRLFFKELCLWVNPPLSSDLTIAEKLRSGIRRIQGMQYPEFLIDEYSFSLINFRYGDFYVSKLDPSYFDAHLDKMLRVYEALHDDASKECFLRAIRARFDGSFAFFQRSAYQEYFHPQCQPVKGDVLIDGGIWDSTVISHFAKTVGKEGHVYGFEPLPSAYANTRQQLQERENRASNITLENMGLAEKKGAFYIKKGGQGSKIQAEGGANTEKCIITDIDSYVEEHNLQKVNMIKLDIEGAEPEALQGAVRTLQRFTPKLAISIYHAPLSQLIEIPIMLQRLNLGYTFWMGHHILCCPYGTILYAKKQI